MDRERACGLDIGEQVEAGDNGDPSALAVRGHLIVIGKRLGVRGAIRVAKGIELGAA